MDYKMRLGATLEFDSGKELDLIKNVKDLTERHKLGAYINNLLRYVWENPEQFKGTDICPLANGLTPKRQAYFNNIEKELSACKKSIDEMYKEMIVLSTAAKVGATFGLVENASEFLMGLTCIEEYVKRIRSKLNLGVWGEGVYESAKKQNTEEIANQAAEVLVKILMSKRVDLRINSAVQAGVPVAQPMQGNATVATVEQTVPKNNGIQIEKEDKPEDSAENDANMDLLAEFCNI